VANPRKEPLVLELLQRNRDRLVTFLAGFLTQREAQDEHFHDEKAFLIEELRLM
jgi:calcium binding protein 39